LDHLQSDGVLRDSERRRAACDGRCDITLFVV
jgi:hypothetical protein